MSDRTDARAGAPRQADADARRRAGARTALACVGVAALMVGASFAAVPLYRLFCQTTGFGGTPMVAAAGSSAQVIEREITVRFDANVAPGVGWTFRPDQPSVKVKLGETKTVFYTIANPGDKPTTGVATFNVQPDLAGQFFVKVQCFCFEEQTLQPGETVHAPVVFYVDPDLLKQPETKNLTDITLSYTVFRSKNGRPVAVAAPGADKNKL